MKCIARCALLIAAVVLLAPPPAWTTTAVDEALVATARVGRDAVAEVLPKSEALPPASAPPPAAGPYAEALAEPGSLEAALRPLASSPTPASDLPGALAETGTTSERFFDGESVFGGDSRARPELVPAALRSYLGLPAPVDVAPR